MIPTPHYGISRGYGGTHHCSGTIRASLGNAAVHASSIAAYQVGEANRKPQSKPRQTPLVGRPSRPWSQGSEPYHEAWVVFTLSSRTSPPGVLDVLVGSVCCWAGVGFDPFSSQTTSHIWVSVRNILKRYMYELIPVRGAFWLRNFAPWFFES